MKTYAVPSQVSEEAIYAALDAQFTRGFTYMRGDQEDYLRVWYKGDTQVLLRASGLYSVLFMQFKEVDPSPYVDALDLVSTEQAIALAEEAHDVALIRATNTMACLLSLNVDESHDTDAVWTKLLTHSHPAVVTCALRASSMLSPTDTLAELVGALGDTRFASVAREVQEMWETRNQPYLPPTHDVDRLINRIHESLRDQQWDLALDDANTAIALDAYAVSAHILRARALDGKHDSWGAWTSTMVARWYAFGDPLEDTQPFFELHQAKLGEREVTPIARQIALDFCMSLGEEAIVDEVRRMYLAHDTTGRAYWLYLEVLSGADLDAISALEPDSFMLMFHQAAQAARSGDGATAKALWQRWNDRPEFEEGSFDAFAANAYDRVLYATPSLGSQFQALVSAASSEKDYDEVLAVTELWEELEPGDLASWTWRGIAYTFTQRPTEAIECYSKAIELHEAENEDIYFGEHPISTAHFNRACERSRITPVDEGAFEDLYQAVKLAARYAEEARADDYMAAIWNDPRFEDAISRGLADGNQADNYEDYNDEFDA